MGCAVVPVLGVLAFELVTEVAFLLGGCWAGGCAAVLSWSVLPPVGSRHSPAKVEKMELICLQAQIKIDLSPFFLCILKGVHTPSQLRRAGPHWGFCEGCWEIGCCLYFPSARAIKGEGAVPPPAAAPCAQTGSWRGGLPLPRAPLPLPPRSPTPSPPGSLAFV